VANPLDFLQLTPENIAQAKGMGWGQALKTDLASGYNPKYTGKGATGLGGYIKSGFQSLAGNVPASGGVGGATPLTRKLALTAMNYAPKALGIASKFLGPASFLFGATPANADEINMTAEDYQNLHNQDQRAQLFKQQHFMNRKKQQMQQKIQQAEAAEAAKQKAAADAAAAAHKARQRSTPGYGSAPGGQGFDAGTGRTTTSGYSGRSGQKEMMADGGLIDFYRYGGFSG